MSEKTLGRRGFIVTAAGASVGAMAVAKTAQAADAPSAGAAAPSATTAAPAAASASIPPPKPTGSRKLDDVLRVAREKLYPRCRVCPYCDGEACAGEMPGMGGVGTGSSFKNNVEALARVRLQLRTMHEVVQPDLTATVFGYNLAMPVMCASLGGTTYNMGGKMSEEDFIDAVLGGADRAGTMAFIADGVEDPLETYKVRLAAIGRHGGRGVGVVKPRENKEILARARLIEEAGGTALAVDIDSSGRAARAAKMGAWMGPKSPKDLEQIARGTKLPLVLKGIMTVDEAKLAVEVGAKGIVVSNHGGRNLDHTPGTAEVLPAIADKVKGKVTILVDGGIRYGNDVLKVLALGADAALVGRPIIRGAHGGGAEGVHLVLEKMRGELAENMVITGTASTRSVSRRILATA